MKNIAFVVIVGLLSACSNHYAPIDSAYVKDCNDRGGKVERIEYSSELQCIGATK